MYVEKDWEIERIFSNEVRDKKRIANGILCKTGKRGYIGRMKTTADLLKANDKRGYKEYIKGGSIKLSNMYNKLENVPSFKSFSSMENNKALELYSILRKFHTVTVLKKYWGISGYKFYQHLANIGGEVKSPRITNKQSNVKNKPKAHAEVALTMENDKEVVTAPSVERVVEIKSEGFELIYNKNKINGGTIQEVVVNLVSILNGDTDYEISLNIKEK